MKKIRTILFSLVGLLLFCPQVNSQPADYQLGDFGAFYTRIQSGEDFEKYARVGDHADVVVDLGQNGATFNFWRGSSYLPYLQVDGEKYYVEEVIPREGDGTDKRPDRVNLFSRAKIVKNTPEKVVVHWRYMPDFEAGNPHTGMKPTDFVDEYFYIHPDGTVKRTIKEGTEKIDDWRDPKNHITQTFLLTEQGIADEETEKAEFSEKSGKKYGVPVIENTVAQPAAWWKFDEGKGEATKESQSGTVSQVAGHKALWSKGVSGTSLQFDGYNSVIEIPDARAPEPEDALTVEGWMAVGAYPWSYTPMVQQVDGVPEEVQAVGESEGDDFDFILKKEDETGYFFGLNGHGKPVFKLRVGGKWEKLVADFHLERKVWYHLAATYTNETGMMKIYVNGKPTARKEVAQGDIELSDQPLKIGQGKPRRPIRPVRMNTFKDTYSFDGLMDEIKIYKKALSASQIDQSYHLYDGNKGRYALTDMDYRELPSGKDTDQFGAYYTHLDFYDVWDNLWRVSDHPDVVVEFEDNPSKFIFWRGVGYIPMISNEKGQWYSNEFNETWNKSGGEGCQEPMSDKESFYNRARILENTPARVVVHWRFPLIDVHHTRANVDEETGWSDMADWYYYIYPDGIAVKTMHLWTHGERNHEWQESMAIFGPNQHPEQIIETRNALTMMGLDGQERVYDWVNGPPANVDEPENQKIQYVNYTGKYDPLTIGDFQGSDVYGGELTSYAVFPTWNHWPVSQMPSDGRKAAYPDRTAHSSLTHVFPSVYDEEKGGPTPYYEKILLEGMVDKDKEELIDLGRSWMKAPKISSMNGATGSYDPGQRAYKLTRETSTIQLTVDASNERPMQNISFVVKDWNSDAHAQVRLDGKDITGTEMLKQGITRDTDGSTTLVLFIEKQSVKPVDFTIAKP